MLNTPFGKVCETSAKADGSDIEEKITDLYPHRPLIHKTPLPDSQGYAEGLIEGQVEDGQPRLRE
ncbi:MAG: hypothetical protein ACLR0U_09785 [Enterocloster clostridioformis]